MKTNRAWIWLPTVFAIVHESIVQAGKIFISGHERLLICISGYFKLAIFKGPYSDLAICVSKVHCIPQKKKRKTTHLS